MTQPWRGSRGTHAHTEGPAAAAARNTVAPWLRETCHTCASSTYHGIETCPFLVALLLGPSAPCLPLRLRLRLRCDSTCFDLPAMEAPLLLSQLFSAEKPCQRRDERP